jgi:hypothetical protein
MAIFIVAAVWLLYMHYLQGRFQKIGTELDETVALDILTTYGVTHKANFYLWVISGCGSMTTV